MRQVDLLTVNYLLYELNRLKSPHALCKKFIPLLQDAVATIEYYEEENKALRAEVQKLTGEL